MRHVLGLVVSDWSELADHLSELRKSGKRIVSTNGVFDLMHVGHVRYLAAARSLGDCLVVGVNSDACTRKLKGPQRPFLPDSERMELLAALSSVDFVTIFDEPTPVALLTLVKPDFHVKGGDYHVALLPEAEVVKSNGGEVVTVPFEHGHSTTALAESISARMQQPE